MVSWEPHVNTTANSNCGSQFDRVVRGLIWSGLSLCIAAATIYDIGHWMLGW
jgi:hypothetical protein